MGIEAESTTELGSFLQDCEDCPDTILEIGGSMFRDLRLKIMFCVSHRMGNLEKLLMYGYPYMEALRGYGKYRDASIVAEMMAAAILVFDPDASPQEQLKAFDAGSKLLRIWIETDRSWSSQAQDKAASKLLILAKAQCDFKSVLTDSAIEDARNAVDSASKSPSENMRRTSRPVTRNCLYWSESMAAAEEAGASSSR